MMYLEVSEYAHCEIRKHEACIDEDVSILHSDKHAIHADLS
jgi:hypothetical protein